MDCLWLSGVVWELTEFSNLMSFVDSERKKTVIDDSNPTVVELLFEVSIDGVMGMFEVFELNAFELQESDVIFSVPVTELLYGATLSSLKWRSDLE